MTDEIEWERTPRWLQIFGYKPWRYWELLAGVGGDFSRWIYADQPPPPIKTAEGS